MGNFFFFSDTMSSLSLKLVDTGPSHHTAIDNWIDSIFVDQCDTVIKFDRIQSPFPNRHDIITATIDVFYPMNVNSNYTYKCINKINPHNLNSYLEKQDWYIFTSNENLDVDEGLALLTSNLKDSLNSLAPDKTVNPRKELCPWINTELQLLISKRNATSKRYQRTGSRQLFNEYLELATEIENKTEIARNAYMHNRITSNLDTGKYFWLEMKNLGLIPKVSGALHGFLPEELNSYFSNISFSSSENSADSINIILSASPDGFAFKEVTVNDVILAVSHFNSQAKREDGMPQSLVAKALPTSSVYLTNLFKASLKKGVFPAAWKRSYILALKKVSIPSSTSDFRPIALLCFLSKVLEKLAHDQIVNFLNKSNILDKFHTGFRKHHSTQTALRKLVDDICMTKDKKFATLLLQFDFSKARKCLSFQAAEKAPGYRFLEIFS